MAALDDFLSFLQGASNSAASAVSAPVDGINWALGKVGVPVSKKPVGGSEWLKELGFTAEPKNKTAGLLGEAVGGVLPIVAQAKAPQIAAGINQMISNAQAPRTLNPQTGAIVWHGSPHKFDRFDSSKIGTGEGAQAYGHGLYLAEAKDVAGEYARMKLNGPANVAHVGKKRGPDGAMESLKLVYPGMPKSWYESAIRQADETGSLYKVDLPDDAIAKMLDWDKPFAEMGKESQALVRKLGFGRSDTTRGSEIYNRLAEIEGQAAAANALRDAGIPGIRYLDGGSRGTGQGTSNFVVFPGNEGLLSILERNGQRLP